MSLAARFLPCFGFVLGVRELLGPRNAFRFKTRENGYKENRVVFIFWAPSLLATFDQILGQKPRNFLLRPPQPVHYLVVHSLFCLGA